ncbi:hypothetical protein LUZ60_000890 [Juncus effusus]|nr:hypothetical protein LUZ60_000890 [Juncus effusus]
MNESPNLAQELAVNGRDPPSRYILKDQNHPISISSAQPSSPIPVIDLSRLSRPDGGDELAKLRSALESWGLFLLVGHGIPQPFLDEVLNMSRDFFNQPLEEKQKYTNLIDGKDFKLEGYGNDIVKSDEHILDWNDRLYLLVQPEDQRSLSLWPTTPTSFKDNLHEFGEKTKNIRDILLKAMAKSLNLKEDSFTSKFNEKAIMYARFNYYPPCSRPDRVFGLKPHSDGSVMTILLVDKDVGGLQVVKNGEWFDVPTLDYSLLVNLGDGMEIMSNGIFKSPVHRALTNSTKERLSIVMFCALDPEKELEPDEGLIDDERPRVYKSVKTKDYIASIFETFAEGTRAIDLVRV